MKIVINTKNKLKESQIKTYVKKFKGTPVVICIPAINMNDYKENVIYVQNFIDINELIVHNLKGALVGHSLFKESLAEINMKVKVLTNNNLNAVICIGETFRDENTYEVLEKQINLILKDISNLERVTIAYEPIWAIGGDKDIDYTYIIEKGKFIREILRTKYNNNNINLLYGGSVNLKLIENISICDVFDGFLISSMALDENNIEKIIDRAS